MISIISLLEESHVFANLNAADKNDALTQLIDSFEGSVEGSELVAIRDAVFEREAIMSTGVGKGLAIPHGKAPEIETNHVAFALLASPIDYQAVDDEPVSMIFLLAGPSSSNSLHIKMLSRISRLMNNQEFRNKLNGCQTSEEIMQVFEEEENVHFGA